ncbi:bifunctional nuclease family protein [Pseudokineococcus basanitobsidens]|uniref:Bifunctional nuclease family protein n=1 Tax=Pseudokineococcus basanitobsidens TaxID=1926649 RepID=A0ABU8RJ51_9ACTN
MRELEVVGVRVEMPSNQPIVLLREAGGGERYLPIWIGAPEASAIAFAQQGVVPPRPLTHDLLKDVIGALGRELEQVRIVSVRDNVFYAELVLDGGVVVSARSSDAIALALRAGCSILGADEVLESSAVGVPEEEGEAEDEVERFREFLDQVSAEDFEAPEGGAGGPGDPGSGGDRT